MKYFPTKYPGVRYRKHPSRIYNKRPDLYFAIYYYSDGKRRDEGLGWSFDKMSAEKASIELARIKEAIRTGRGHQSLKEAREAATQERTEKATATAKAKKESITFDEFFVTTYSQLLESNKAPGTVHAEKILYRKWLKPILGNMPFNKIENFHIEKIKKTMQGAGRAPRSIEYALSLIRQIWNAAKTYGLIDKESPTRQVKKPKFDNQRKAYFSQEQADALLETLSAKSTQIHDMALLSLHTGMRANEIFSLCWADVDTENGVITILDAKGGSRFAFMTSEVRAMFERITPEKSKPDELVFAANGGKKIKQISNTFMRTLDELGFNAGVSDRRHKLTFHSLRHTHASWLVADGTPLYTVQKLLGHKSLELTMRYAHLSPDTLKTAVSNFEKNLKEKRMKKSKVINIGEEMQ